MFCDKVFTWMLAAAKPEEPPDTVVRHFEVCRRCRRQWQRLIRLESVLAASPENSSAQVSLERFLQQHGFGPADAGRNVASAAVPSTLVAASQEHRPSSWERLRWPVLTCVAGLIAAIVAVWLVIDWPRSAINDQADSNTGTATNGAGQSVSAPALAGQLGNGQRPGDRPSATGMASQGEPTSATRADTAPSHQLPMPFPRAETQPTVPLDGRQLLTKAQSELQLIWRMLDQTLPLLDTVEPNTQLTCMTELTVLLAEEALHQARIESVAGCVEATAMFEHSAVLVPKLALRLPPAAHSDLLRKCRSRFVDVAESVRQQLARQPHSVAEPLRQLAEAAQRTAAALDKLVPSTGPSRHEEDKRNKTALDKLAPGGGRDTGLRRESATARLTEWVAPHPGSHWLAKNSARSANETDLFCVVFMADEEQEKERGEGNLTAYLVMLSLRQDFLKLVLGSASRLVEQRDSRQRMEIALDMAEGLVRMLAVVSGAGPSPLAVRIGEYLGATLSRMIGGNWPRYDIASDSGSTSRQQAWKDTERRLTDLVMVLRTEAAELPEAARLPWEKAIAAAEPGIEAVEWALEQGPPQPPPQTSPPAKPAPAKPKPTATTAPMKPIAKPLPEPPRKPEKPKPIKPAFKPGKLFPERFEDLKDLWRGKKR